MVLVTLMLAALMMTRLIDSSMVEMLIEARQSDAARLRMEAYSAMETTLAVLADVKAVEGKLYMPSQGWSDPLTTAEYEPAEEDHVVTVDIVDESGKISLPEVTLQVLRSVLEGIGLQPSDAERVADAILVWTKKDYTPSTYEADPDRYERQTPSFHVPGRPLRSFAELANVAIAKEFFFDEDGRPTPELAAFQQVVSLYRFKQTNLNAANSAALGAIGLDTLQAEQVEGHLKGERGRAPGAPAYFRSATEAAGLLGLQNPPEGLGVEVSCLRVTVTVRQGQARFGLTAVVTQGGQATAPGPAAETPTPEKGEEAKSTPTVQKEAAAQESAKKLDYPFVVLDIVESPVADETS